MKIVICDDSREDLKKVENLLAGYMRTFPGEKFAVEKFSDASALYDRISRNDLADIYILDMIMPEKSGIDLGSLLDKVGKSVIVYITSSDDFALEAYGVHAVRYLVKPVREEIFFEAMDYAVSYVKAVWNSLHGEASYREARYPVKTKDGLVSVLYSDIEYIENASRILDIHLTDGSSIKSIFIRKSFDEEIREIVKDRNFARVHKSFLINMNHIRRLTQDSCFMEGGRNIPVSKTRAAEVKKEYLLFVSEQYR
ncbi:MAG: response regulator transcription factor [Lachnospiraceae bacterium]|jgi:DNA-binding LytR/AlgR family response regulator|nr:response regulator transcription factor [Lachnospiraceae bacterium]